MMDTIGQQLKQARLNKNITIDDAVQATRIRAHYIKALEADDFESLPSAVQTRGFLRIYTRFLDISLDDLFARQRASSSLPEFLTPHTMENHQAAMVPAGEKQTGSLGGEHKESSKFGTVSPEEIKLDPISSGTPSNLEMNPIHKDQEGDRGEGTKSPSNLLSFEIFSSIADTLHQRRDSLSLSLDEIERHIHVKKHYLLALESGEYDLLPSSVQARGMLQNYAVFLGLDVDVLLLKYADALQAQLNERQQKFEDQSVPRTGKKSRIPVYIRRYLSPDILIGGGLAITLALFAIWGTGRILNISNSSTTMATALSISDFLISSPSADIPTATPSQIQDATAIIIEGTQVMEIATLPAQIGLVQVVLVTNRNAWVKVIVDGKVEFEGRLVPGTAYTYDANSQVEVITGDGGAVNIIYNQSNLGTMGAYGEVVHRIYTRTTILMPTATFTPTPTTTPTPTVTPRPSSTPRPSVTPLPSASPKP